MRYGSIVPCPPLFSGRCSSSHFFDWRRSCVRRSSSGSAPNAAALAISPTITAGSCWRLFRLLDRQRELAAYIRTTSHCAFGTAGYVTTTARQFLCFSTFQDFPFDDPVEFGTKRTTEAVDVTIDFIKGRVEALLRNPEQDVDPFVLPNPLVECSGATGFRRVVVLPVAAAIIALHRFVRSVAALSKSRRYGSLLLTIPLDRSQCKHRLIYKWLRQFTSLSSTVGSTASFSSAGWMRAALIWRHRAISMRW